MSFHKHENQLNLKSVRGGGPSEMLQLKGTNTLKSGPHYKDKSQTF